MKHECVIGKFILTVSRVRMRDQLIMKMEALFQKMRNSSDLRT